MLGHNGKLTMFSKSAGPRTANTIYAFDGNPNFIYYQVYYSEVLGVTDTGEMWTYERQTAAFKTYRVFKTVDASTKFHSSTVLDIQGHSGIVLVMEDIRAKNNNQISVHFVDWDQQGHLTPNWQYYGKEIPSNLILGGPMGEGGRPGSQGAVYFIHEFGVEGSIGKLVFTFDFFEEFEWDPVTRDIYGLPYTPTVWQPTQNYLMKYISPMYHVIFIPMTPQPTIFACQIMLNDGFCNANRDPVMMPPEVPFMSADMINAVDTTAFYVRNVAVKKRFDEPAIVLKWTICNSRRVIYEDKNYPWSLLPNDGNEPGECINPLDPSSVAGVPKGRKLNIDFLRYQQCFDTNCADCSTDVAKCNSCLDTYWMNSEGLCNRCDDTNCDTCLLFKSDYCKVCKSGFIVDTNNQCVTKTVADTCTRVDKDENTDCVSCKTGYATPSCTICDTGYAMMEGVCAPVCSFENCLCTTPNTCSSCKPGFDGPKCIKTEDSCKFDIIECDSCASYKTCKTCNPKSFTAGESCDYCLDGYIPESFNSTKCSMIDLSQSEDTFDAIDGTAMVEFAVDANVFAPADFKYVITDQTSGQTFDCYYPKCSAKVDPDNSKALVFTFDPNLKVLKGSAVVLYPLNSLVANRGSDKRRLQTADATTGVSASANANSTGSFQIDNLHLIGKSTRNSAKTAKNAYTAVNAIRFFSTLFLSVLNTAHAFWATNVFSWLQVWSLLRGSFLVYPERLLDGHSNWFLLVINFGEPWKDWADWNTDKTCRVNTEYPLNKLGCSMTDTFGQNIIVIICVFAFCLVFGILYLLFVRSTTESQNAASNAQMTWGQRFTMGLGFNYFLRWLQAIQPSLIFFSITQWYSFKDTSRMGLGVFWSIFFFIYFFTVTVFSVLLALKVWAEIRDNRNSIQDQTVEWTARRVGGFLSAYAFLYCDLKTVTGLWQLFYPVVEFLRAILVSVFIIAVDTNNKTSLGLVLLIELLRIIYHSALFKQKVSSIYGALDFVTGILLILYLILKNSVVNESNEKRAQEAVGSALGLFIGMIWGLCLFDMVYDLFVGLAIFTDEKGRDYAWPNERGVNAMTVGTEPNRPVGDQSYRMGDQSKRDMEEGPSMDQGIRAVAAQPVIRTSANDEAGPVPRAPFQ